MVLSLVSGTMTINTSYTEELHQPASTTRKLAMSFNGGGQGKSGDYTITTNLALLHLIIQVELSIVVMYQDLLLVQIFKLMIFQQLIQEEIIHLSHGIKAHRQVVLTMFINQL